ncbi:MAG: hypothetical protein U1E83_04505 [Methylotetracoccus sp.]
MLGFALILVHLWWMVIGAALGILAVLIARSFDDDTEYVITADEVERIEAARRVVLSAAGLVAEPTRQASRKSAHDVRRAKGGAVRTLRRIICTKRSHRARSVSGST